MSEAQINNLPVVPVPLVQMDRSQKVTKYALFKCLAFPSCRYIFPDGKAATFVQGRYLTNIESEIRHLEAEVERGSSISIDPNERVVDSLDDPMEALRKKIIADYLAQQERALDAQANVSESEEGKLNVANTATLGAMAARSDGAGVGTFTPPSAARTVPAVAIK